MEYVFTGSYSNFDLNLFLNYLEIFSLINSSDVLNLLYEKKKISQEVYNETLDFFAKNMLQNKN